MNYLQINPCSFTEMPGVCVTLFVSGCRLHCKGCQNPEGWCFNNGYKFTQSTIDQILILLDKSYITGLCLCGGDPMEEENQPEILNLLLQVKDKYPNKKIWCYTGYEFHEILSIKRTSATNDLLKSLDALVVGRFEIDKRDISPKNPFRGSTNQRILDSKSSLALSKPVAAEGFLNNVIGEE